MNIPCSPELIERLVPGDIVDIPCSPMSPHADGEGRWHAPCGCLHAPERTYPTASSASLALAVHLRQRRQEVLADLLGVRLLHATTHRGTL